MTNKRLKSYSSGESLAELMVAALIISFAMIMVLSVTRVGTDILSKSRQKYEDYYTKNNKYEVEQAAYVKKYLELYPDPTDPISANYANYTFDIYPKVNKPGY